MALYVWGQIDALRVHSWKGWLPQLQDQLDIYNRVGQTGRGMQIVAKNSDPTEVIVTAVYDSMSNAKAAAAMTETWQGRTVVIIDGYGRAFPRVRLNKVKAEMKAWRGPGPFASPAVARVTFTLLCEVMP